MPSLWTLDKLISVCKAYADRYDIEVGNSIEDMISLAEDRMSRVLKQRNMSTRKTVPILAGVTDYALDDDFGGMRDISIDDKSIHYLNPEQLNHVSSGNTYYSIIANNIVIKPTPTEDNQYSLDIVYYKRIPPLVEAESKTNWLLQSNGDIYVTAVCAEIELFVKNDARANEFWARLGGMFAELETRDWEDRWSGNPLAIRLENINGS